MKLHTLQPTFDYLNLDPLFYHKVKPTPLKEPFLVSANPAAFDLIGLDFSEHATDAFVEMMNGERLPADQSYAMCYAGHQFGYFVSRLGDGRAINLGKVNGYYLQLKGAGKTRYSRGGDGRAVLRSSIREYLMSEAMHYLGIPTSRALALIGSNHPVQRKRRERGAIVMRLSPSWVRFGTFEYFYHNNRHRHIPELADFVIAESYPHLQGRKGACLEMFGEITDRTAKLMALWQSVGFNHGVMNTDNMSIAGLTIDYGPFAFSGRLRPELHLQPHRRTWPLQLRRTTLCSTLEPLQTRHRPLPYRQLRCDESAPRSLQSGIYPSLHRSDAP